jgi:AraC-like DNA-binding protein
MTSGTAVQFWQPAPEVGTELLCACLEAKGATPHLHEEWQFGVLEAPSRLSLGAFRRSIAGPNEVTIVRPYDVHAEGGELGTAPKWRMLYVAPSLIRRLYGDAAPRFRPVVTDPAAAVHLRELLRQSGDGTTSGSEFLRRVSLWLEQFLPRHAEDLAAPYRAAPVERARAYLQSRPTCTVTMSEVGAVAGVSIRYLVRSFSRIVGLPPRRYHGQVRLARARRLLAEGNPIIRVAHECRFSDQPHLGRQFKEYYGITPGAFQAQYRAGPNSYPSVESSAA